MLPNQLNKVLEMAVNSASGDGEASNFKKLSDSDKKFLSAAMENMYPDCIKILKQCIENIDIKNYEKKTHEERVAAFTELLEQCDNLDVAVDFEKLGGFRILANYIDRLPSSNDQMLKEGLLALDVLSTSCQLNEHCQERAIHWQLLNRTESLLLESLHNLALKSTQQPINASAVLSVLKITLKTLSALSSICRGSESSIAIFLHIENGKFIDETAGKKNLTALLDAMNTGDLKVHFEPSHEDDSEKALPKRIRNKSAFFLRSLITRDESAPTDSKSISPSDLAIKAFVEVGSLQRISKILANSPEASDYAPYEQVLNLFAWALSQSSPAKQAMNAIQPETKEACLIRLEFWKQLAKENEDEEMLSQITLLKSGYN